MPNRTTLQLVEELEWRNKTVRYLSLFLGSDMAEPEQEEILNCMTRMLLEIENILEQTSCEDRRDPGDEGPLGPLPPEILGGGKEETA